MNRYYETDKEKWFGPLYLGKVLTPQTRVSKWHFRGDEGGSVDRLGKAYRSAVEAVDELRQHRSTVEATKKFTPLGVTQEVAENAIVGSIPKLRRARAIVDKVRVDLHERQAALKLAKPTDEEHRQHVEIRAAMRSMTPEARQAFLKEHRTDPMVAAAIVNVIPALSGVHPLVRQNIREALIEQIHGEALGEIRDMEEVVGVVDRLTDASRNELREIIGCTSEIFENIARVGERGGGELPFRVETHVVDGRAVDISRVYDLEAKLWRDATADEISRAA